MLIFRLHKVAKKIITVCACTESTDLILQTIISLPCPFKPWTVGEIFPV